MPSKPPVAPSSLWVMLALGFFCWSPAGSPAAAQTGAVDGQWRSYGGDAGHTKYSALDQINEDNVGSLEVAWTWMSVDEDLRARNEVMRRGSFQTYAGIPMAVSTGERNILALVIGLSGGMRCAGGKSMGG